MKGDFGPGDATVGNGALFKKDTVVNGAANSIDTGNNNNNDTGAAWRGTALTNEGSTNQNNNFRNVETLKRQESMKKVTGFTVKNETQQSRWRVQQQQQQHQQQQQQEQQQQPQH